MEMKPLHAALALAFGAGGVLSFATDSAADTLSGSLAVTGTTPQTSAGPSFEFVTSQNFFTSLSAPYTGQLVGDLGSGIMSVQAVTGGLIGTPGDGSGMTTYSTTITNTGSTPQAYTFNFYIGSGTLIADPIFNFGSPGGSVSASIDASIALNGQTAFSYSEMLTGTATGSYSGITFQFNPAANGPSYSTTPIQDNFGEMVTFSPYTGALALGTLAPGQSEQLTYTLSGTTTSDVSPGSLAFYGGALAQIGDPFSVQGQGLTTFKVSPTGAVAAAVPEPDAGVIAATGLLLLGGLAARRRRTAPI